MTSTHKHHIISIQYPSHECLPDKSYLDSLRILAGFDFTTRDSHFTVLVEGLTSHILSKKTCFMNHTERAELEIMILKPTKK